MQSAIMQGKEYAFSVFTHVKLWFTRRNPTKYEAIQSMGSLEVGQERDFCLRAILQHIGEEPQFPPV